MRHPTPEATVAEIASQDYAVISADTSVFEILTKMRVDGTEVFLLAPGPATKIRLLVCSAGFQRNRSPNR